MNLGIEYAIRSGEVKHHLSFPLSLFVTASPSREKSVVTIHPRRDGRLTVKRWRLGEARANEVLNQSGRYYTDAYFTVKLYDDSNDLLGVSLVLISHFGPGKKKTFDATTDTVDIKMIKKYEIVFENEN
jgi:hypothetical protein